MKHFALILLLGYLEHANAQSVYYPLEPGTRWQFWWSPDAGGIPQAPLRVVGDTIMPNGISYAAIQYSDSVFFAWERQSADSVFTYRPALAKELLIYRFNANKGDTINTFQVNGTDTVDVFLMDSSKVEMFGRQLRSWTFGTDIRRYIDDESAVTIVDSIGVIRISISFGYYCLIAGAIVDGLTYGNVMRIPSEGTASPRSTTLSQNYPNPFNNQTTLSFSLAERSSVKMDIFNALGQSVRLLFEGQLPAGPHSMRFDGRDLPSGVYYYKLALPGSVAMRKMLLMK